MTRLSLPSRWLTAADTAGLASRSVGQSRSSSSLESPHLVSYGTGRSRGHETLAATTDTPPDAFFYRVGVPTNGYASQIQAASADGSSAAGFALLRTGAYVPVVWRLTNGIAVLPGLPYSGSSSASVTASDMSADGTIIVGRALDTTNDNREAVLWTNGGQAVVGLGYLTTNGTPRFSSATAVSRDGTVVYGYAFSAKPGELIEAFRWTAATGLVSLGFASTNDTVSVIATGAVSADGNMAAGYSEFVSSNSTIRTAVRYTAATGLRSLGNLPGGGNSLALAASASGEFILGEGDSSNGTQLFLWGQGVGLMNLGTPEGYSAINSERTGLSADGRVAAFTAAYRVGQGYSAPAAFLWNTNGFVALESVLTAAGLNLRGLANLEVLGMSDDARVFYGAGQTDTGSYEGWVARIPAGMAAAAIQAPVRPFFTAQPSSPSATVGQTASFSAQALSLLSVPSSGAVLYQWRLDGQALPGATNSTLNITNVQLADAGNYSVVAYNTAGALTSQVVNLTLPLTNKWAFDTTQEVYSSPAVGLDGTVFFGASDGKVHAVNGTTGKENWSFTTGGPVYSSPAVGDDGRVYVGSLDQKLYAFDSVTGSNLWVFATPGWVYSSPCISAQGTVYFGTGSAAVGTNFVLNGKFYAVSATSGTQQWAFATGGNVDSSPALGLDHRIYFGSADSNVYALDSVSGTQQWVFATGGQVSSSPAVGADGTVYVGSGDHNLYALDGATGAVRWKAQGVADINTAPIIGVDGTIYLAAGQTVVALDGATGNRRGSFNAGVSLGSAPVLGADGTLYVASFVRTIIALDAATGISKWSFNMGPETQTSGAGPSSPALGADGTLYVGSGDGKLYAVVTPSVGGLAASVWPKFHQNNRNTGRTPVPALSPPLPQAGGGLRLNVSGDSGQAYEVQASTDLTRWLPVADVIGTNAPVLVTDTNAPAFPHRFYRAVWKP